jgi:glycerophosphoryl diester phosphodiesterase
MIIAHRGYAEKAQENSLSAFDAAIKAGAGGIECDVRPTKDGKAIINHNGYLLLDNEKIEIAEYSLPELQKMFKFSKHQVLDLDLLFEYIEKNQTQFFLELKSSSPMLIDYVAGKIKANNLWEKANVMGFPSIVKSALLAQSKYPKLKVGQFLMFPPYAYIQKPKKCHTIFMGWLDGIRGSQTIFRSVLSLASLTKLRKFLEKNGFNVKGGVINNKEGFELFKQAGITDIVTDRVTEAVNFFKKK